jgi:hypothetical protein
MFGFQFGLALSLVIDITLSLLCVHSLQAGAETEADSRVPSSRLVDELQGVHDDHRGMLSLLSLGAR